MPRVKSESKTLSTPPHLRPYEFHGVLLDWSDGDVIREQALGDCPFCSREGKLYVATKTGQWDCKVCGENGNAVLFLRKLWKESADRTNGDTDKLRDDRKLLDSMTLTAWGAARSITTGDWLIPGFDAEGKLRTLYKYIRDREKKRMLLLPTPEMETWILMPHLPTKEATTILLCEGVWDAAALWETMRAAKQISEGNESLRLTHTASEVSSLLSQAAVLAVPSCGAVGEPFKRWLSLFSGKRVVLAFHSDHPRQVQGKTVEGAGYGALKRAANILYTSSSNTEGGPPSEVHWLKWGERGYDPEAPSGYDCRDMLTAGATMPERVQILSTLLSKIEPIPGEWVTGRKSGRKGSVEIGCEPCDSWKELINQFRKAMKWFDGIDIALSVMFASILSTKALGENQLWVKIIGPPSSGKSTLCEALSVNRKYIYPKDTFTGLISGYQVDREGSENMSLADRLRDKTLVINDGDTLLQLPNLPQVLSQLRAFYGRNIRSQYGNRMSTDHEAINCTIILCGTASLHKLDASELGERFLDCVIMDKIDDELEDEILIRKAYQENRNLAFEADGRAETQSDPDLIKARQLTGGYVDYLRANAKDLLAATRETEESIRQCVLLGKFTAYMRAKPRSKREETDPAEREFASRLVSQIARLARCLAVVLNEKTVNAEVIRRVRRVALDTSRGRTLELTRVLYPFGLDGLDQEGITARTHESDSSALQLLRFLRRIGVVESFDRVLRAGLKGTTNWRLTPALRRIYKEVIS